MTFQPKNFQAEAMVDDCEGAHPWFDNDSGRALVFVLEHCDGAFTVNLQGSNGSGWQSDPYRTRKEANRQADIAAAEARAVRVRT